MSRGRQRPKRGQSPRDNVLVLGDIGIFAGPQGGAEPGASESGDLASREYGVPQADLPGGKTHLVNPQTQHRKPPGVHERGADEHKYHGVEPTEPDGYVTPPDASDDRMPPRPEPAPKYADSVPVHITERPGHHPKIRTFSAAQRRSLVASFGDSPPYMRIAARDPDRVSIWIQNESGTRGNVLLLGTLQQIQESIDQGTTSTEYPAFGLIGNTGPQDFDIQDELYCANPNGSAITISWGYITEVEVALAGPA